MLAGAAAARAYAIAHSVGAKARIVAEDERETTGARALLNLGHTFGHALEAVTGFSDRLFHGEGVAVGMVLAAQLSAQLGMLADADAQRVQRHLVEVGLPTRLQDIAGLTQGGLAAAGRPMGLLAQDKSGLLVRTMNETVDGEYQNYKAKGGKYTRDNFFAKHPELLRLVETMSDEEVGQLNRGGHDPHKLYAAYYEAVNSANGRPTVILAKTVKGYGMGEAGEGQNVTHQQKKMGEDELKAFRDRFKLPITDDQIASTPFYKPAEDSPEIVSLK